jgi:hypothetical protein
LVAPAAPAYVVKPKGGNWLAGSVEKQMDPMLTKTGGGTHMDKSLADMKALYTPEVLAAMSPETRAMAEQHMPELERGSAINKWIKGNLTNYVKNEMATPQDPLRALAEKGISHLRPEPIPADIPLLAKQARQGTGFPAEGMGQSDLAKQWEMLSDRSIAGVPASHYQALEKYAVNKKMKDIQETDDLYKELGLDPKESPPIELPASQAYKENPWLAKVGEETPIYSRNTSALSSGFAHIVDVLKADLASGRIRPDQLNKVSMDQAVRRTVEYDQELARKMEAARAASMEGMPVHKEYPEGYKWVELKRPGEFAQESDVMGHSVRGYEPASGSPDWITTSGDEGSEYYGHGGWEGIKSGKAKIYSLRDPKGESHATVEVGQGQPRSDPNDITRIDRQAQHEANQASFSDFDEHNKYYLKRLEELKDELFAKQQQDIPNRISQIKGKQNRAPSEEYQPYIQDFVKSGQWSDVGDLQNTGLIKHPSGKYVSKAEIDALSKKHFGESMGNRPDSAESADQYANRISRYDPEMLSDTDKGFLADWQAGNFTPEGGMKHGGEVSRDQMMMAVEDQKFGIGGMVSKAAKAMKAAPAKEAFVYPQQAALKLAQQRAALPIEQGGLGLPAKNTPMERAKAMNASKELTHFSRTGGDFDVLDSGKYAQAPFDAVGTHLGTKEAAQDRLRNTVGTTDQIKGTSYPVTMLGKKPLMNPEGKPWTEDALNAFLRQEGDYNNIKQSLTYPQMNEKLRKKLFEEQGYTNIPYINEVENKGVISHIVPPENIRSRNAAYDPFRKTAATAAALGVAAPDLLAEEVKKKKGGAVKHPRHAEFVAKIKEKMAQVKKMAEGGAVDYNSTPDMSDGGQLIPAPAYKAGGKVKRQVKISNNLDTMLMELGNKRNK